MEELENAILILFQEGHGIDKFQHEEAQSYCSNVKSLSDAWKWFLQLLRTTDHPQVKFFCWQSIAEFVDSWESYKQVNLEERQQFHQALIAWFSEATNQSGIVEQPFVRNKFAQVYVKTIKADYPDEWPRAFQDLLENLNQPASVDLFLRIMESIDEDIIAVKPDRSRNEIERIALIKDTMKEDCIPNMVQCWCAIVQNYLNEMPELAVQALSVFEKYINWIDIGLSTDSDVLRLLYDCLGNEAVRENSCECISEIVLKRMPPEAKLQVLQNINILNVLSSMVEQIESMDEEGCSCIASVVDSIVSTLLECLDATMPQENSDLNISVLETLSFVFDMGLVFLNHSEFTVSQEIQPSISSVVSKISKYGPIISIDKLIQLTQIIARQVKYPESFNFDLDIEEEAQFEQFRHNLGTTIANITRINSDMVLEQLGDIFGSIISSTQDLGFSELEAPLFLLQSVVHGMKGVQEKLSQGPFAQLIKMVISSRFADHQHYKVVLDYYELCGRYGQFFSIHPDCIPHVLSYIVGERGLRHEHSLVRSRSCYILGRICKGAQHHIFPWIRFILDACKELLVIPYFPLSEANPPPFHLLSQEDQLNLYESISILLLAAGTSEDSQAEYFVEIGSPLLEQLQIAISTNGTAAMRQDVLGFAHWIVQMMAALGCLTKNWISTHSSVIQLYSGLLDISLNIISLMAHSDIVRQKVIFVLHRMIECLGEDVLITMDINALQALIVHADLLGIIDIIGLLNQFAAKIKGPFIPVLNMLFLPVTEKVFTIMPPTQGNLIPQTSDELERLDLEKSFLLFLNQIVSSQEYSLILVAEENASQFQTILNFALEAMVSVGDETVQRHCILFFTRLLQHWSPDSGVDQSLTQAIFDFITTNVFPGFSSIVELPNFQIDGPNWGPVLQEIGNLHSCLLKSYGQAAEQFILEQYLPSLGYSNDIAIQCVQSIQSAESKQLRKLIRELFSKNIN